MAAADILIKIETIIKSRCSVFGQKGAPTLEFGQIYTHAHSALNSWKVSTSFMMSCLP